MEKQMKFALFSGSTPEWSPEALTKKLAVQGWHGVEWRVVDQKPSDVPGFWAGNLATYPLTDLESKIDAMNKVTLGAGLAHAAIAGYVALSDRSGVDNILALTAKIGAGQVRIAPPKTGEAHSYKTLFDKTRADAKYASERASHYGVKALIQIHHGNIISTASSAIRLMEGLDPNHIGLIHDLGNMAIEGREGLGTYTPSMEILGPYLAHIHVKNAVWTPSPPQADGTIDWSWKWAPLPTGFGDVKAYFKSLKEIGYDGWVTVENFTTEVPLAQRLSDDLKYLKDVARATGYLVK
jgi:sugar phosphate isomerase/epimerase